MALLPQDPEKQKKILLAVVPLLGAFFYWYSPHAKATAEIVEMQERLEVLETANNTARIKAAQGGAELEKKLALYAEHIGRLEQLIPQREEVPQLLHAMAQQAQETGVDLAAMRPAEETPGQFYTKQTYELGAIGAYHQLGQFLASIGSLRRIVTATGLSVSPTQRTTRTGEAELQAKFRIETYVIPAQGTPAPADSQGAAGNVK